MKNKATSKQVKITSKFGFLYNILEFKGSKPHEIRARIAPALHWVDRTTGEHRFALRVWHPGFAPLPHMRPMMKDLMRQSLAVCYKHYGKIPIFTKHGIKYRNKRIRIKRLNVRKKR